jgi:hypothetical protein
VTAGRPRPEANGCDLAGDCRHLGVERCNLSVEFIPLGCAFSGTSLCVSQFAILFRSDRERL